MAPYSPFQTQLPWPLNQMFTMSEYAHSAPPLLSLRSNQPNLEPPSTNDPQIMMAGSQSNAQGSQAPSNEDRVNMAGAQPSTQGPPASPITVPQSIIVGPKSYAQASQAPPNDARVMTTGPQSGGIAPQPLAMAHGYQPLVHNIGQTIPSNGYHDHTLNHHRSVMGGPQQYPSRIDQRPIPHGYRSTGPRGVQPSIPVNFHVTYGNGGQPYNPTGSHFNGNGNGYQFPGHKCGQGVVLNGSQPMNSNVNGSALPATGNGAIYQAVSADVRATDSPVKASALPADSSIPVGPVQVSSGGPVASPAVAKVTIGAAQFSTTTGHRPRPSGISSVPQWMHDKKHPSPYSLTLNPLQLIQRDLHALSPMNKDEYVRTKLYHYLHNGWNAIIEMNNKIFNERTRCRICGQTPRTEYSFREMNHGFSRKTSGLWKELQKTLSDTNPEFVTLEQMEEFYDMYWEVERVFWEDDNSFVCGVSSWTGHHG